MVNLVDRARLLIRMAKVSGDEADRQAALSWAEELLGGTGPAVDNGPSGPDFPLSIFRRYKGKQYDAFLLQGWKVQLNGRTYRSPSAAARGVSVHQENGLRVWRYLDPKTGREGPIGDLRAR